MAEKRRGKQKKLQDDQEKPTKEEYAVAKYMRFNVPSKEGKLHGMSVQYFIASKAIDMLLESKWGNKGKSGCIFVSRAACTDYCERLLQKGMFHRAAKLQRTKKEKDKKKKKKDEEEKEKEEKSKKEKKSKKNQDKTTVDVKESDADHGKDSKEEKDKKEDEKSIKDEKKEDEKKKKKERKWKLEMHQNQIFKEGDEVYVWIYDPVPFKTFMIGLLLVLGAIAICLFPLWPPEVRLGIYYISLLAAGFVGFILLLCVVRLILFCIVWGVTLGKHHFWFLPNLTEDVGFFDSFKPLYHHEAADRSSESCKSDKEEEQNKDKEDSKEADDAQTEDAASGDAKNEENVEDTKEDSNNETSDGKGDSGSDQENENDFEVVEADDLHASEESEVDQEPKKTK